jgi:Cu(I)/Ag(I) efflux system membrane protein CusA/SilA
MVNRLVDLSLRHRGVVLAVYLALAVSGYVALRGSAIDALPDLSDHQVIVFTDWTGHSAQEVEDQVTYPLSVNLQGLPGVRVVRSQSAFGFSMVYVIFEDGVDLYFARTRVLERLNLVTRLLPAGVVPTLGPDATGVGHVFWYTVESPSRSLRELRGLQDWFIRYQLSSVPGVAEVASVGGTVQQYQVDVDPNRLRTFGVSLGDVVRAVAASNANVGGNVIESNGAWSIVRGVGLVESAADIGETAVRSGAGGVPVLVRDVADVKIGDAFRVSSLVKGTSEAVGGVVVARIGANAREVIAAVKQRLEEIATGLPADVRVVPFYDRSVLIDQTAGTLRIALLEEIALVTLAHVVFLLHARSVLIVTLPLPLAVLASFLGMRLFGISSNIMSLAGIAIAIGVLVDAGIVVTENAFREIERQGIDTRDRKAVADAVRRATRLVARPVFFSMSIILLAFAPVFALTGQEGRLFLPLAAAKTLAVLAATVIAVTLVPVLCTLLLRGPMHSEAGNPIMRGLMRVYRPLLDAALSHRAATLGTAAVLLAGALLAGSRIGSEFMPRLDEGDLLFMPIADPSISLAENTRIATVQNAALLAFPEVEHVVAKVGRAETSTDPSPLNMTETIVHLKRRREWRPGLTLEALRAEMGRAVNLPGVANIWTMPIINRIDMLTTGVRSEVGVKIYGADLDTLSALARRVADVVGAVPGASDVYPEPLVSGQYLNIRVNRPAAARYGLTVGDVHDVVQHAIGETVLGTTIEGRARYPIRVRFAEPFRADPGAVGDTLVTTPAGQQVALRDVADVRPERGPAMISSENGLVVATVLLNVQDRDVGGFVEDAKSAVARDVTLPAGYVIGWGGQYENQQHARARLQIVLPVTLVVIFLLLWVTYRSPVEAAHVLLAVPFALTGGLYLVWLLGYNFSVAVWVGFIALFGTAVQTGVVMVIYLEDAVARAREARGGALTRAELRQAVVDGALLRLRPKVMTVVTVVAGLLPLMWSTRVGAEVMKPLAAPVLGGMVSSLLHVLVVTPVIFFWLRERELRRAGALAAAPDAPPEAPHAGDTRPGAGTGAGRWRLVALGLLVAALAAGWWMWRPGGAAPADARDVVQTVESGDLTISIRTDGGVLRSGRSTFDVEFRSGSTGGLVDVRDVRLGAAMAMPGMVMPAGVEVTPGADAGRFIVSADFAMAGTWRLTLDWNGPAGPGSVVFTGEVQ